MELSRLGFLRAFVAGAILPLFYPLLGRLGAKTRRGRKLLRPPGAKPEDQFLRDCIACGQCANVCPNKCITLVGLEAGIENLGTPRIDARAQGCILCMACTRVCPTQALEKLEPTEEGKRAVRMGLAFVSEDHCYSFAGRTCGVCYRACPLPGEAMTLGLYETPTVHTGHCVGCGLCEQACVQMPQAIRVVPLSDSDRISVLRAQPKGTKKPASRWKQGPRWDEEPSP
ncbi:MAG: 4Fe-4S dicluster domain-containing protein [Roseibacillus sp.]|nr:4Fe-4S dicluster domain-containing protein [Roseibacillus sp.]MDP7657576.1 4Fe-4S dicluster domain-containing protein [Roseibacillus sp.]HJM65102.1 4Fe-4S dicluster domain-containing protein [Roseibacillus sp.]